jgi:sugar phosphate isomerase/epimerase
VQTEPSIPRPRGLGPYLVQLMGEPRGELLAYAVAHGHGVEVADFAAAALLDDASRREELVAWYQARLGEVAGPISFHGVYRGLAPSSEDAKICAATRDRVTQCLDLAERVGARSIVFHSDFDLVPTPGHQQEWAARQAAFWGEVMAGRRVQLMVENCFEPEPEVMALVIDAMGEASAGVCFDTGHAHMMSALWARALQRPTWPSPGEWLTRLGTKVHCLHLSDNDGRWDRHSPLGQGTLDWEGVVAALAGRESDLPAVIEVAGVEGATGAEQFLSARRG